MGELSPEVPNEPLLVFVFPLELGGAFTDEETFLVVAEEHVPDETFVDEPLEEIDLSSRVDDVWDILIETSIPPLELDVEDVMLLFISDPLETPTFPLWPVPGPFPDKFTLLVVPRDVALALPLDNPVLDILTLEDVPVGIITDVLALFIDAFVTAEYPFDEEGAVDAAFPLVDGVGVGFGAEVESLIHISLIMVSSVWELLGAAVLAGFSIWS